MKKITLCLFVFLSSLSVFGQTALHRKAEKRFSRFEFASASHIYQKIVKKNPDDQAAWVRLAQCYKVLNTIVAEKLQASHVAKQSSASIQLP